MLSMALRYDGWQVEVAANGTEAVELAEAFTPDVMVLDIMLPDFDGMQVLSRLRNGGDLVPVLFLTALGSVATAVMLFSPTAAGLTRRLLNATLPVRFSAMADRLLTAMIEHGASGRTMAVVLVESVGVQLLRITQAFVVGSALGLTTAFPAYLALVPLALLVLLLPVSVGGMGTGQAAFMLLFSRVGVSGADAFTLGTLLLFLGMLGSLPGGLVYAWKGCGFRRPANPEVRLDG